MRPSPVSKRLTPPLLALATLLLGLAALTTPAQLRQEIRKRASNESYTAVLELSASGQSGNSFTIPPGETFQVQLKLIPNQALSAADIVLDFDRELLEIRIDT